MSHFGDFMDGVPVKISEKFKRPQPIALPYSVNECPLRAQNVVDCVNYCSTFERNILAKLKELRSAKETKKHERRHRLHLLEEAKQKKLDAIAAAEAEEKLKQLSISEVSYPSTEEISPLSTDDKPEHYCDTPVQDNIVTNHSDTNKSTSVDINLTNSTQNSQSSILQPIQVKSNYQQCSLLDDPDPLQELKFSTNITKAQYSHNVETLTFKDFENDTSSPFDNVELKTINDMELLAQVLQSQRDSSVSCQMPSYPDQVYSGYTNCATQAQLDGGTYLPNAYQQTIQGPNIMYSSPQHFPASNGYYVQADTSCDNTLPLDNVYVPNYQYYVPTQTYADQYYNASTSADISQVANGSYIPQPYYYQYQPYYDPKMNTEQNNVSSISSQNIKSRSRSVPDIVRELNEELATAKLRAHERSCNVSPAPETIIPRSSSISEKRESRKRKQEQLPNPFEKFPPQLRNVCQKIHGMGFPLDRVARVCSLVGDNDKKIIEGLLIVGELMDLGFSEGRVSAALAKHEFNRDKALDELVS
ncbi:uncharacterized protein LOC123707242 [Pieris brassicae]|uniref:UBA domain-containing protein n=1 Tax=Pieris brassicae TaxID=7116 RepID=A0A9P0T627_PIEBR|nr:uncharacterized protein LOC123707242 [Pieris brassicae]XP_045513082.1 uncharacterized protein LOC123707242 [Pieris brassicae]CAH4020782.1 unnamed protein product [Pieris brassicae]